MSALTNALKVAMLATVAAGVAGAVLAAVLRGRGLKWTWALLLLPLTPVVVRMSLLAGFLTPTIGVIAAALGAGWHRQDLADGGDLAEGARTLIGPTGWLRRRLAWRRARREPAAANGRVLVGRDEQGWPVRIPAGGRSGRHMLVVGATGSGKTVTQALIASQLIAAGHGAIVIDPKGDDHLKDTLSASAFARGARVLEWGPEGPCSYNPYATGTATEIADKALSGETFTEPHYLRQAQRYLGHAVRAMQDAKIAITPASLMSHLDPPRLEATARQLEDGHAQELERYLDTLTDRQKRDLAGVRDRLSILAESDAREWLRPAPETPRISLADAVKDQALVYFRLDADRRPLLAGMLGAAIISDLITLVGHQQRNPTPTVVLIDEFSAVAAEHVSRLFGRARSAGISLILGTQELADLDTTGSEALKAQTLGNIATLIAHRQNTPQSAELIAEMAGSTPRWITTWQTDHSLLGGPATKGSRRRGYEFSIHPTRIKQLPTGQAAVITPGAGLPRIAQITVPGPRQSQLARLRSQQRHRQCSL